MSHGTPLTRLIGMLKWFLHRRLTAFERQFSYDVSYMRHVLDHDLGAFLAFGRATRVASYRKDVPLDLYYAVKITGLVHADCGPCTQLVVGMALREGLPAATIAKLVRGDETEMTDATRLGTRFARAVIARDATTADELRAEIVRLHGERAPITLGLALVGAQLFPTMKYALGYGHACTRVQVDGISVSPKLVAA